MKIKRFSKAMACILSACMILSSFTVAVSAASDYKSETHDVFKHTESTLAPGIEQSINYAYAKDGKQMVYYVATADVNRDDVVVQTSYLKQHENGVMGMEKLTNQIAYANEKYSNPEDDKFISEYYNVVAGVNASFYNMQTGQPMGITYIDGVSFGTSSYDNFFAILNDGKTAVIDYAKNLGNYVDAEGNSTIWQAAAGSQWLVRDGEDVTASATGSYNTDRHSRTCVGVTEDGKVVMMVLDGRQEPFSCGGSMHELAQIMLEQGCVAAINLDGGGSTTYAARQAGTDSVKVINRPSDGSERSISSGLIIASTAAPSNVFDTAVLNADNNYVTPGSTVNVSAVGVSPAGTFAEIPADVTWQLADSSFGTVSDGVFTSNGTTGDAEVQMVYGGKVVGKTTIHVVIPESIKFSSENITVPYGKELELEIIATYGLNKVTTKASDFELILGTPEAGTLNGLSFTACEENVGISSSTITAVFNGYDQITASATLSMGKGSEILWDFEDGDVSDWSRYNKASYNYILTPGTVSLSSKEDGGIVHRGNYALKFNMDFSVSTEGGYMSGMLGLNNEEVIDLGGATSFGMWIYVPIEAKSLNGRIYLREVKERNEDGSIKSYNTSSNSTDATMDGDSDWNVGFVTQYQESGWHYISFDLTTNGDLGYCIPKNGVLLDIYINDRDNTKYNYNHLDYSSLNQNVVMYVDDVTLDYSSVVVDREFPIFSGMTYADTTMSDASTLNENAVLNESTISFSAAVTDDMAKANATGLDASTAKAYIDGVEVTCKFDGNKISVADAALVNGNHTIKFSICDKQGNYASIIRNLTVKASGNDLTAITLKPHDVTLDKILLGSLYYVDIVASDAEKVDNAVVDLDLNNISRWELDHMEVADGFKASYKILDKDENIARISITRIGTNNSTSEMTLVSMPIRTWELPCVVCDGGTSSKGKYATYEFFKKGSETWPIDISVSVISGVLNGKTTFAGDKVQVDTESYVWDNETKPDGYAEWNGGHDHRPETKGLYSSTSTNHVDAVALPDKEATCTEAGYTGRTFCEVCNSVVDWGTTIPATGHTYETIDGVLKCKDCGELFNGEYTDGKTYFDGVVANGLIDGKYYVDGVIANNYICIDGVYYVVENGVKGSVYTGLVQKDGKWCYSKLGNLTGGWISIDNDWYYFDSKTFEAVNTLNNGKVTFSFEDNGKLISGQWYKTSAGCRYYYGPSYYSHGWHNIDGYDYYFGDANVETGYRYEGLRYVINSNSHTPQWYDFGTDGKAVKLDMTGLLTVSDKQYYLVNGISQTGLQLIDGKYYYFSGTYESKKGIVYVSSVKSNSLLPEGYYLFKDNYQMADEEFGIWQNKTRYIRKGQPCFAGLILNEEGKINYIGSDCCLATGICTIPNNKTNGLLPEGTYAFGIDGTLVDNNFAMWQGNMCYMRNGQPYAAGLVRIDNDIYYIRSNCQVATGIYWVSENKTNEVLESGFYLFDTDGTLVNGKFGDWNGNTYYIKNGQPFFAGVIEYEGKIVYVGSDCKMNTGVCYITSANGNGILTEGYYFFSEDGSLLDNGFGKWTDGNTYYFRNGQRCAAGAVEIDGSIYYINSGCRPVTGKYYVSANKGNGILSEGYYTFDSDGSLISK